MLDAYKLRRKTNDFDILLAEFLANHPGGNPELKTKRFINGRGGWNRVNAEERKAFLAKVCRLAVSNGGKIYAIGLSFDAFDAALAANLGHTFGNSYWLAGALFTSCMVQKKMQKVRNSKGLTVVIMDDNKREMPAFSDALYDASSWFDGLYQSQGRRRGRMIWHERNATNRFDHIINTAFAIKSNHSSLAQVADAISYVYRRYIELKSVDEVWEGEQDYYQSLIDILEPQREKLGRCPDTSVRDFYCAAKHPEWDL